MNLKSEFDLCSLEYGYQLKVVELESGLYSSAVPTPTGNTHITRVHNLNHEYVGNLDTAMYLYHTLKLQPELIDQQHSVCSIGFSKERQKWYGWSHRAHAGFGIGNSVDSEGHICRMSGWTDDYLKARPEDDMRLPIGFTAHTLEDAKRMAIAAANALS